MSRTTTERNKSILRGPSAACRNTFPVPSNGKGPQPETLPEGPATFLHPPVPRHGRDGAIGTSLERELGVSPPPWRGFPSAVWLSPVRSVEASQFSKVRGSFPRAAFTSWGAAQRCCTPAPLRGHPLAIQSCASCATHTEHGTRNNFPVTRAYLTN